MMLLHLKLLFLKCVVSEDVVVTAQGRLLGVQQNGYVSYTGIPYATISDKAGRFKRAGLAPFWLGVREAATPNCSPASAVEECLRLDVHVPPTGSSPLPVFVWVRGVGGQYHVGKLVQQGVIVVVVYHRLGPVGFLCLHEEDVPGNAGAKDLVLALRWVRDNIVAFRGNPAKVIVAGQGFGAAMVEAMTLSPMGQGLYHGIILQSGTALSPWAFNYDAEDRAKTLGAMLSDYEDTNSILLNANLADLLTKSEKLDKSYFPFALCVEKAFKREERFLSETPYNLLSSRKVGSVPVIIGYNSDEAYIFVSNLKAARALRRITQDLKFLVPDELKFRNEGESDHVVRQIKDMYFKNNYTMAALLAYHRDAYFLNHIYRSVRRHASVSNHPIYFHEFSYAGDAGVQPEPGVRKSGAAHSDELAYLFSDQEFDGDDKAVQHKLVKLWTNFAKYLTPTPRIGDSSTWDPVDPQNPRQLHIGAELRMEQFAYTRLMQMWDDIYEKYYYTRYRV